ncbi:nucleotide exchange factor GrpE [Patescibacteria group bacterium]|nr:nucleotide exchange factor GrpE [Patescibacteria group bacterium]
MKEDKKPTSAKGFGEAKEENKKIGTYDVPISGDKSLCDKNLKELEKQKNEYLEGWKRERADFLNYKREEMERIVGLMKYANEEIVLRLLPILDNFSVAEKNISEEAKKDENIKGLLLINQQIKDFLKTQGVEEIKAVGIKFDPNFHEVVEEVEGKEHGIITEEIQKGYLMQRKVIRPAKVKITK